MKPGTTCDGERWLGEQPVALWTSSACLPACLFLNLSSATLVIIWLLLDTIISIPVVSSICRAFFFFLQSFLLVSSSPVILETNIHTNRKKNGEGVRVKYLQGSSIYLWPAGRQCSLGGTWRSLTKVILQQKENLDPNLSTSLQWEPAHGSVGDLATAAQLVSGRANLRSGVRRESALCLTSGATSEEIALYISKCTTLSLGDQSITANWAISFRLANGFQLHK